MVFEIGIFSGEWAVAVDGSELKRRSLADLRALVARGAPYPRPLLQALQQDSRAGARTLYAACQRAEERLRAEKRRLDHMLLHEKEALANGFKVVAGVDEAGRGPFAGPIVAAAVVLCGPVGRVNDSKQLTAEERETLYQEILGGGHSVGVSVVSVEEINAQGIQVANYRAMAQAVEQLTPPADFILVDGFRIPGMPVPQKALVKGDALSQSIAAASIVAKVTRDRLMVECDKQYPGYGFAQHKGYGTPEHYEKLAALGPCEIHRRHWGPVLRARETGALLDWVEET